MHSTGSVLMSTEKNTLGNDTRYYYAAKYLMHNAHTNYTLHPSYIFVQHKFFPP